jgi:hypothetical protein
MRKRLLDQKVKDKIKSGEGSQVKETICEGSCTGFEIQIKIHIGRVSDSDPHWICIFGDPVLFDFILILYLLDPDPEPVSLLLIQIRIQGDQGVGSGSLTPLNHGSKRIPIQNT